MTVKIYILSQRYGTEMAEPDVYLSKKAANDAADEIMKEVLESAYCEHTGRSKCPSFKSLVEWAEREGFGNGRYFWDGSGDATELLITEYTLTFNKED